MNSDAITSESAIDFRDSLRGLGPVGIVAFLIVLAGAFVLMPVAAALILFWAWLSKTPWREIGLARPKSWIGGAVAGIAIGVALKFLLKAVILPYIGAQAVNHSVLHDMGLQPATAINLALYSIYGGGFAEELVFRGYLFERLGKLIGSSTIATLFILVFTTALFASAHWQLGPFGMAQAVVTGLTLGSIYLATGRKLWVPMFVHAAFDVTSVWMIYYGYENQIAHLVFK
ncbi:MAG TPA: type II CAAX endopeptidase family protein [Rhizomicrobium sp.]